jgi:hypothetical protein
VHWLLAAGLASIVGGSPAPDEDAVVGLARHPLSCEPQIAIDCTATLIAPRVVITAAHCLGLDPPNVYDVFFGASVEQGGTTIAVIGGHAHPEYDPNTFAHDIAVLLLASDAPVAPMAVRIEALPDLAGADVTIAGFGVTDVASPMTGVRSAGIARVAAVANDSIDLEPGPAIACAGDSGGPVISNGELIAVTSHGDAVCMQTGHAWRVDRERDFIVSVMAELGASRTPFDPNVSLCERTCATDRDCPADTVCFGERCVYRGLPPGTFSRACTSEPCITVPDGSCRHYEPCAPDTGCGCGSTQDPGALLLVLSVFRRRARRAARRAWSSLAGVLR